MELADEYMVDVVKVNIKQNRYLPGQYSVFAAPTILLIHKGEERLRESRFIDFDGIRKNLDYLKQN